MITLNIDLLELNDLYYAVGKHRMACEEQIKEYGKNISSINYFKTQLDRAIKLESKVQDALHNRVNEMQEAIDYIDEVVEKYEDEGPEYDGAGFTEDDRIVKGQYRNLDDVADVNVRIHFVDNDEADEDAYTDYHSTLKQDEQRYNDKQRSEKSNGVSQFILDFVQANGVVSYTEMNDMYRAYTKGSNSFSHILKALQIPYKNRPTQRYLVKHHTGGYFVATATPRNWVVVNDDYRTFNEAPYGND